jgi:ribosomal protein S18 acetylase RimI-like enzyme
MIGQVTLRCAQPSDQPFLRALYVDTHPEFAQLPPAVADGLIELQLRAQRTGYLASFPASGDELIELAGTPVGRCWTDLSATELRLLDLAVLSGHRRQGIGRIVLDVLHARAVHAGVALWLSVWQDNLAARRLYDQQGFVVQDRVNGYLSMVRT